LYNLLGIKGFATEVSRTGILATTTPSTGIQIQKLFPSEVLNLRDTEYLGVLKVNRNQSTF
jgi:hypothetical protein